MRTKIVYATLALAGVFAITKLSSMHTPLAEVRSIPSLENEAAIASVPSKPKSNARAYLSETSPVAELPKPDVRTLHQVLEIDKKVLKTRAETEAYQSGLQDETKLQTAAQVLSQVREPRDLEARLRDQQSRMDAALFLTRALEWKQNPKQPLIKKLVRILVLDDALTRTNDLELRKSLAADRIELFANLKSLDRTYAQSIQASAVRESSQKLIQFANNFYRLDEARKN